MPFPAPTPSTDPNATRAAFNPLIRPYLVLTIGLTITATVVGIPLAILWFLGVGQWWARHYFDRLECELTPKTLRYRKGIIIQIEKTIPLENIQDVTFIEGPLLRQFNLSTIKFETAGQSQGQGSQMTLTGVIDAHAFREAIMAAREKLRLPGRAGLPALTDGALASRAEELETLHAIHAKLDEIAELLKPR
jgi:membrane protein YdbS with pleckstrin-like domain